MFKKKKYNITYKFINHGDTLEREESRIPQIGEEIEFTCFGNRRCVVESVTSVLKHDSRYDKYYIRLKSLRGRLYMNEFTCENLTAE